MPLLKDLITIPERVHQGDFVLRLTQGVTAPEQTLRDYVAVSYTHLDVYKRQQQWQP